MMLQEENYQHPRNWIFLDGFLTFAPGYLVVPCLVWLKVFHSWGKPQELVVVVSTYQVVVWICSLGM